MYRLTARRAVDEAGFGPPRFPGGLAGHGFKFVPAATATTPVWATWVPHGVPASSGRSTACGAVDRQGVAGAPSIVPGWPAPGPARPQAWNAAWTAGSERFGGWPLPCSGNVTP